MAYSPFSKEICIIRAQWLAVGLVIYALYGFWNSKLHERESKGTVY